MEGKRNGSPGWPRARIATSIPLVAGGLGYLAALLIEDFWSSYPAVFVELTQADVPQGEDALAVATILMLPVVQLGSPALLVLLERSRVMTWILRLSAASIAGSLWFFFFTETGAEALLSVLASSSTLTLVGLSLVRHPRPPESRPA